MEQEEGTGRTAQQRRKLKELIRDPQLYLALAAGVLVVWGMSPLLPQDGQAEGAWRYLQLLLLYPLLEELLFRGLIQGELRRRLPGWQGPLSHANLLTSLLFATSHLYHQPALWAVSTFVPSLLFGYFRDRYHHLLPAVLLHVIYNSAFFLYHLTAS